MRILRYYESLSNDETPSMRRAKSVDYLHHLREKDLARVICDEKLPTVRWASRVVLGDPARIDDVSFLSLLS